MNLVDANVLLYAVNKAHPKHQRSKKWLDDALNNEEPVGFAWIAVLAFLRLATKTGLFPKPLTVGEATATVTRWLAQRPSVLVEPGSRHLPVFTGFLEHIGTGGNLVNDAHLAALSVEHQATVVSYDNDFERFPGIRWRLPDEGVT